MNDLRMILTPSIHVYTAEILDLKDQGYDVDWENNPPCFWGVCFEVGMIKKNDAGAEIFAGTAVADTINVLPIVPQPPPERNKGGRPRKA